MRFELETSKGTVTLSKDHITLAEINTLSKMIGVDGDPTENKNHETIAKLDQLKTTVEKVKGHTQAPERPRRHPLVGSSESEGFPIGEIVEEKKDDRKSVKIICPECNTETTGTTRPFFKYKQCKRCATKVFIVNNLDTSDEYDMIGTRKYLTHKERIERKLEQEAEKSSEELRKRLNSSDFPMKKLQVFASLRGYERYSHLRKPELVDYLIDKGAYINEDGNLRGPEERSV